MALRPRSFREVRRKLIAAGFVESTRRGSHVKFVHQNSGGTRTVIVPDHREIAIGTLRSILRQCGLTAEDFDKL